MTSILNRSLLIAVMALTLTGVAYAHAHLESASPAPGATIVTAPAQLSLTFSEGVNPAFSSVTVTGPDEQPIATGEATPTGDDDTVLSVPLQSELTSGTYTVQWRALSVDGHSSSGDYQFTIDLQ